MKYDVFFKLNKTKDYNLNFQQVPVEIEKPYVVHKEYKVPIHKEVPVQHKYPGKFLFFMSNL